MMLYENIKTEAELAEFASSLNAITHHEQYLLFNNIFNVTVFRHGHEISVMHDKYNEMWVMKVGPFALFVTTLINMRNHVENPEYKTGFYEKFYFHLSPDDPGISQKEL